MKTSSRCSRILVTIGRCALLVQVAYLCAYVGWRCVDDRLYSVSNTHHAMHRFADRVFAPVEQLCHQVLDFGEDSGPSTAEQIRKARMTLQQMGHRVEASD